MIPIRETKIVNRKGKHNILHSIFFKKETLSKQQLKLYKFSVWIVVKQKTILKDCYIPWVSLKNGLSRIKLF